MDVTLTNHGRWQNDARREHERARKSRYRALNGRDTPGTGPGHGVGQGVGHLADGEVRVEKEKEPLTPRFKGTNPRANGTNPRAAGTNPRELGTNRRGDPPGAFRIEATFQDTTGHDTSLVETADNPEHGIARLDELAAELLNAPGDVAELVGPGGIVLATRTPAAQPKGEPMTNRGPHQ